MNIPASKHFTPLPLSSIYNADRRQLPDSLWPPPHVAAAFGDQTFHGIPFAMGDPDRPNVILLDQDPVTIDLPDQTATYILFLHVVENRQPTLLDDLADFAGNINKGGDNQGNELGQLVSDYTLSYADGTTAAKPILRRFAIQQAHISWGASAFAAVPALSPEVFPTTTEAQLLGRISPQPYGQGEVRNTSGRGQDGLWLYALFNPHPEKSIRRIECAPKQERSGDLRHILDEYRGAPTATRHTPEVAFDTSCRRQAQRLR